MDSNIAGGESEVAAAGVDVDLNCPGSSKEGEPAGGHKTSGQANQVYRLALRELGGGVGRYHRPPSVKKTTYEIAKPTVVFERIRMMKKLRGHHEVVNCSIFDRSAQLVITGSDDATVKIWSTRTGFCLGRCIGHDDGITDLAVSSKNNFVASASSDDSIRVWRLPDGFPVSVLGGHGGAVTAIEFSPRQGCEHHLLSSSEDGMCRIWDARYSAVKPHVYKPAPRDIQPVPTRRPRKASLQVSNSSQPALMRILCCAFNADGTIFVAGSSDNKAMVWSATECNFAPALTQRPTYELDTLVGHDKHVHCVRFSGCGASRRPFLSDSPEEDYPASFKNTWSARDSIVTCSRDASAIIWIPLRRRHNSEADRWVKAYHLKASPYPIPSELPTPRGRKQWSLRKRRGVNIIVWSLDSRFLLGAITDCRICVWNALDGSLAHSLTGHDKQTYVLDVHPFNPRIAMSVGYDGRAIIWDIWCGHPIRTYNIGADSLVDGNFSPDGSSLVVSDNVGHIYLFATGDGRSLQNAKYEQFFRREQVDNSANVVGEESRNSEDVLCDESLFPYDLQYQHIYREERLAEIKWNTPTVPHQIGIFDPHDAAGPLASPGPFQPTVAPLPEIEERDVSDGYWSVAPLPEIEESDVSDGYWTVSVSDSDYSPSELELDDEEEEEKDDAYTTKRVVILDGGLHSEVEEADDEDSDHSANIPKPCRNKGKAEAQAVASSSSRTRKRYNTEDNRKIRSSPSRRMVASSRRQARSHAHPCHAEQSTRPIRQAAIHAAHRLSNIFYEEEREAEIQPRHPVERASGSGMPKRVLQRGAREEPDDAWKVALTYGSCNRSWDRGYLTRRRRSTRKLAVKPRVEPGDSDIQEEPYTDTRAGDQALSLDVGSLLEDPAGSSEKQIVHRPRKLKRLADLRDMRGISAQDLAETSEKQIVHHRPPKIVRLADLRDMQK